MLRRVFNRLATCRLHILFLLRQLRPTLLTVCYGKYWLKQVGTYKKKHIGIYFDSRSRCGITKSIMIPLQYSRVHIHYFHTCLLFFVLNCDSYCNSVRLIITYLFEIRRLMFANIFLLTFQLVFYCLKIYLKSVALFTQVKTMPLLDFAFQWKLVVEYI